jgi:DGQHR domain-containing protein
MRFELFKFLGLRTDEVGITPGAPTVTYDGFILPESPSGFPSGFKVVTFYIDPATLMPVSYVLRKDGWGDDENLYQRMISRSKIKSMRQFLAQEDRVFINNVIVSLPAATRVLDYDGNQIELQKVVKTTGVRVQVPNQFNSIGIIDGQHRVFAYHEGTDTYEVQIAPKRRKQQLLLTGVVYPQGVSEEKQREFEARLFLEINDKQTRTRPDLRQAIEAIVNPFSIVAISRSVVTKLAANGPLCGQLEEHQFDRGKLKSSSIVSYGLRHIVKPEGEDTLFKLWKHAEKDILSEAIKAASTGKKRFSKPSKAALDDYISFCAKEINHVLIGYKLGVPSDLWTLNRKVSRALSTTAVNGVIFCLRYLLQHNKTRDLEGYKTGFKRLKVDFTPKNFKFRSSHWKELGERMAKECFP